MKRREVIADKKCPECGYWFTPTRKGQIFCSNSCRHKNFSRKKVQTLIVTGNAPRGYCPHREDCMHCPEDDCIVDRFSGYFEPEGLRY